MATKHKNILCLQINTDKSKAASLVTYIEAIQLNCDSCKREEIYTVLDYPGNISFSISSHTPTKAVIYVKVYNSTFDITGSYRT